MHQLDVCIRKILNFGHCFFFKFRIINFHFTVMLNLPVYIIALSIFVFVDILLLTSTLNSFLD